MKRYQILERPKSPKGEQWKFVAHGARFNGMDAQEMAQLIKSHGNKQVKLIAV